MTERRVQIGGRVLDPGRKGIAGAVVELADTGVRERTDAEGRFTFKQITGGAHTIRASAVGFGPRQQAFVVPGAPEDYVITLVPL
jgi:iron complex outermembrane receptor protein